MDKIILLTDNAEMMADVVRYFKYNNNYYLIFTYGEKDEKNYQKLYIVQILEELNEKIARNINDDDEWHEMQSMVKDSIKQIRKGNDNEIEKLNVSELNNLFVDNPRFFKLDSKLVSILETDIVDDIEERNESEANIEFMDNNLNSVPMTTENDNNIVSTNVTEVNTSNSVVENVDYKELYFLVKAEKEATDALMEDLLKDLLLYKEKYGELQR